MTITDLGSALLLGLAGSGHCLGMCGGIAVSLRSNSAQSSLMSVSYHMGRLLSYALLGAVIGSAAGAIELAAWTLFLRFLAGFLLVGMGLYTLKLWFGIARLEALGGRLWRSLTPWSRRFMPPRHPAQSLLLGAIWGFMPCGLIYSALTWSAATGAGALDSGLLMFTFGAGTLPAMLGATLLGQRVGLFLGNTYVRKLMGSGLVLAGLWTLWLTFSHADHLLGNHGNMTHSAPPSDTGTRMPNTEQDHAGHH